MDDVREAYDRGYRDASVEKAKAENRTMMAWALAVPVLLAIVVGGIAVCQLRFAEERQAARDAACRDPSSVACALAVR